EHGEIRIKATAERIILSTIIIKPGDANIINALRVLRVSVVIFVLMSAAKDGIAIGIALVIGIF
ncbi:MAG: hypothetical protein ACOCVT_02645, partial [bacterium]